MSLEKDLQNRSGSVCELCNASEGLRIYEVPPISTGGIDGSAYICGTCESQIEDPDKTEPNHWRCLNESMWSEAPAVKAIAWRMLNRLKDEGWPVDLLEMLYLDEETLLWAQATGEGVAEEDKVVHRDCNGAILEAGDSVVLIKDLNVKGGNFTAKRGAHVRNIALDRDNAEYIEGKVDGQHIVIITKYVKKSS